MQTPFAQVLRRVCLPSADWDLVMTRTAGMEEAPGGVAVPRMDSFYHKDSGCKSASAQFATCLWLSKVHHFAPVAVLTSLRGH